MTGSAHRLAARIEELALALVVRLLDCDLRGDFLAELETETARLRDERSTAEAVRWRRRQILRSIAPAARERLLHSFQTPPSWRPPHMNALGQDLRFALRALRRRPSFTALALTTLALAIGANTAIFNLVNGVFFKGVPGLAETEGLVEISRDVNGATFDLSYPVLAHARERSATLRDVAALSPVPVAVGGEDEPKVVMSLAVSGNYFELLRLTPSYGRFFGAEEQRPETARDVVVLSHELWENRFDADPRIVGANIRVNRRPLQVVGVAPAGFAGHWVGLQVGLWMPIGARVPGLPGDGVREPASAMFEAIGRLAPGASPDEAAAELSALSGAFLQEVSSDFDPLSFRARVTPWAPVPALLRDGVSAFLAVLGGLVLLVLTMAASNVANMILARSTERRGEIAARLSLGASRARVVRQLLTESVLLFATAGGLGVIAAAAATRWLLAFEPPLPPGFLIDLDLRLDARVLAFAIAVAALSGVAFSLLPALRATGPDLVQGLRDTSGTASTRSRLRGLLVGVQMAATVVLLVAAGLFTRALAGLETLDPGFRTEGVATLDLDLELTGHSEAQGRALLAELLERVRSLPTVEAASLAAKLPLAGRSSFGEVTTAGVEPPPGRNGFDASLNRISGDYFATLGIDLVEGRELSSEDDESRSPVAVVNRAMANRLWGAGPAVGKSFRLGAGTPYERSFEVVGVAENAKYRRLVEETPNFYYVPWQQFYVPQLTLQVLTDGDPRPLAGALRDIVRGLEPDLPLPQVVGLEQRLEVFFLPQRLGAWVSSVLGGLGLLLGAVGVYGVCSLIASQRRHEIGIRLALGARPSDVVRLAMRASLAAPTLGMAVGLALALVVSRFLAAFLATVSPLDPWTFGTVALALPAVAAVAAWRPARRAARIDPARTLRADGVP